MGFILTLNGIGVCQSLAIVPRHPFRGPGGQLPGVALQLDQVVEGVGSTQLAGVDQAHEQIADLRPVQGAVKQGVLAMENGTLQGLSTRLLSSGAPAWRRNNVRGFQCRSRYEIAWPSPEFGSVLRSSSCAFSQMYSCSITGPLRC